MNSALKMAREARKREVEAAILDFVRERLDEEGCAPTVREICLAVGMSSTASVRRHLLRMEDRGLIERTNGYPRGLRVTGEVRTDEAE